MAECVFDCCKTVFLCYADDSIFASPNQDDIDRVIMDLMNVKSNLKDKGNTEDYLVCIPPNLKMKEALDSTTRLLYKGY
eukprot:10309433-Ditylum_brightwellii.AAC.1